MFTRKYQQVKPEGRSTLNHIGKLNIWTICIMKCGAQDVNWFVQVDQGTRHQIFVPDIKVPNRCVAKSLEMSIVIGKYKDYEELIKSTETDIGTFFKTVKAKRNKKEHASCITYKGVVSETAEEKCQIWGTQTFCPKLWMKRFNVKQKKIFQSLRMSLMMTLIILSIVK